MRHREWTHNSLAGKWRRENLARSSHDFACDIRYISRNAITGIIRDRKDRTGCLIGASSFD